MEYGKTYTKKEFMETFFPEETKRQEQGLCPFCSHKIEESEFRDPLSLKEYQISGLCQSCQDDFFKEPEE